MGEQGRGNAAGKQAGRGGVPPAQERRSHLTAILACEHARHTCTMRCSSSGPAREHACAMRYKIAAGGEGGGGGEGGAGQLGGTVTGPGSECDGNAWEPDTRPRPWSARSQQRANLLLALPWLPHPPSPRQQHLHTRTREDEERYVPCQQYALEVRLLLACLLLLCVLRLELVHQVACKQQHQPEDALLWWQQAGVQAGRQDVQVGDAGGVRAAAAALCVRPGGAPRVCAPAAPSPVTRLGSRNMSSISNTLECP